MPTWILYPSFFRSPCVAALCVFGAALALRADSATPPANAEGPLSPTALAATRDGSTLFIAGATATRVLVWDAAARRVRATIPVPASPSGLVLSADGARLYVTCAAPESRIAIVDAAAATVIGTLPAGHTAMAPVLAPDGKTLWVCNRFDNTVAVFDLAAGRELARVSVPREPVAAALTRDGRHLLVANHLHAGRADLAEVAATVSVIDTTARTLVREIRLPNGSGLLRDVQLSPDGRHAVVTHQISRFHLPTTQIERGWINTNAISVIDVARCERIASVLLDAIDSGAANPWAAAWGGDGRTLCITHAGTHELSLVDFPALLAKLGAVREGGPTAGPPRTPPAVSDDLSFLGPLRRRIKLPGGDRGPRSIVCVGHQAYVGNHFSDSLTRVDLTAATPDPQSYALGRRPTPSLARRGEELFNDASICFQGWQSCASCHSSDARVDALNWDNLNDGIGNPKNAKSLLYAHQTPPSMWLGVRADASTAVRAGLRFSLFAVRPAAEAEAIDEYLQSLDPIPSPRLVGGKLSPAAQRGEQLFLAKTTGCAECHPPTRFFTDLQSHDVGTRSRHDKPADQFDTPTLIEVWRSAPYLHDGSAATMRDVLVWRNREDRHGHTAQLNRSELDDLIEYVLSL